MISKSTRKLAAIMFTDMVGYTALMQENEQNAKNIRDRHRKVLTTSIMQYSGSILQYYGDGTLSLFNSAIDAVNSAILIQLELNAEPKIPLRIGIHIGDIVHDEEGIYGSGVNIASRVESMGIPGSILITERVRDELQNHPQYDTTSLGPYQLKNVAQSLNLYAIADDGLNVPKPKDLKGKGKAVSQSIAVLPFVNMSNDSDNEYFSDGITEEILNALVKVEGLKVTSRTSSFAFKNTDLDMRDIAQKLSVSNILEGSVRKAGSRVRITAQLINAIDGFHLWSESYDRQLEDIFDVQDEISRRITNQLRLKLAPEDANETLVEAPTNNLDAYNLYLRGKFHLYKWTPQGAKKAIQYFEQSIKSQENFSLPYSGLSFCYTMLGAMGQMPPTKVFPIGREMALKALELDEGLSESHVTLALTKLFYDWDIEGARKDMERAASINSESADTHHAYSVYYLAANEPDMALEAITKACELDPLSLVMNQHYAEVLTWREEFDLALDRISQTLDLDPTFRPAIENKGWIYSFMGDHDKAIEAFQLYHSLTGHPLKGITGLGYAYAKAGNISKAEECLSKLSKRAKLEPELMLHMDFFIINVGLNNSDRMLYHLEEALKAQAGIFYLMTSNTFRDLREQPAYIDLLKKYGYK